jgi:hypothetical protein
MPSSVVWRRVDMVFPEDGGDTILRNVGSIDHIPEDGILHSHRRENLNSYISKI